VPGRAAGIGVNLVVRLGLRVWLGAAGQGLAVGIARAVARIIGDQVAGFEQLTQVQIRAQVVGGGLFDRRGGRLPVVGHNGAFLGGKVIALVYADQ
jgi:hypothetical protein